MTFCPRAYLESAKVRANAEIRLPTVDDALSFSRPSDESQRLLQGIFTMDLQAATESRQGADGRYSRMIKAIEHVTALSAVLEVSDWYDPENRNLLAEFRTLRSAALKGEDGAEPRMLEKAREIAGRGMELEQVVGAELRQYERQKQQLAELKRKKA